MKLLCENCRHSVVISAFSTGKCKICKCEITTPHIPSYAICEKHSTEYNLCQQCGKRLDGEDSHPE